MELNIGDCTFQSRFNKVAFTVNGKITAGFKPPRGEQFAVLLIGTASTKADDFDIDLALNRLGFFRDAEDEIIRLRAELAAKSKDADRYAWLRGDNGPLPTGIQWATNELFDKFVDEEMSAAMGEGNGR